MNTLPKPAAEPAPTFDARLYAEVIASVAKQAVACGIPPDFRRMWFDAELALVDLRDATDVELARLRHIEAESAALRQSLPSAVGLEIAAGMLASDGHTAAADEMRQWAARIRDFDRLRTATDAELVEVRAERDALRAADGRDLGVGDRGERELMGAQLAFDVAPAGGVAVGDRVRVRASYGHDRTNVKPGMTGTVVDVRAPVTPCQGGGYWTCHPVGASVDELGGKLYGFGYEDLEVIDG